MTRNVKETEMDLIFNIDDFLELSLSIIIIIIIISLSFIK